MPAVRGYDLDMFQVVPGAVVLKVRVSPRASRSAVGEVKDGQLQVRLHAPPVDGAANEELVDLLAKLLRVPKRSVTIVGGEKSRSKNVRIEGVAPPVLIEKLGLLV